MAWYLFYNQGLGEGESASALCLESSCLSSSRINSTSASRHQEGHAHGQDRIRTTKPNYTASSPSSGSHLPWRNQPGLHSCLPSIAPQGLPGVRFPEPRVQGHPAAAPAQRPPPILFGGTVAVGLLPGLQQNSQDLSFPDIFSALYKQASRARLRTQSTAFGSRYEDQS